MKHWKILTLVGLLLFMVADAEAKKYYYNKWKRKGDKMALLYRPDNKGKWQQVTDFIFDADYSCSYKYWDKKDPKEIEFSDMALIEVSTSEGCGYINQKGQVIIPCLYQEYSLHYAFGFCDFNKKNDCFIWGKLTNGKEHLYHVRQNGERYHNKCHHIVRQLYGEYDNFKFDKIDGYSGNYKVKEPGITVEIDGKIGKVRWNAAKTQFDRILLCEYTEMKIDSISKLDLKATTPKWVTKKYESGMKVLGKNGKYGIFDGEKFVLPTKYDSTSFTIRQHSGKSAGKKKYLTQVDYINPNTGASHIIMQRDGMRCILDNNYREIFAHKLRRGEDRGFDFALSGLGDIYYISADDEKMFFRLLDDSIQVNCRGGLLPKYPFDVMPDKKHTYWLMENEEGAVGLYNSKTDQMILPAEYKAIELPDQLSEVFTVTDKNGVARHAFITHDGASVVQFKDVSDLVKMSKVVKKVGKYQILKYKDAYGIYNTVTKASTALNYTTVKTLGEVKPDVNSAFKNFLLITRGTKKGLVSNDYFFNAMFDQVVLTDSAVAVTFKDWYHILDANSSGPYFNVKPQKMTNFIQYLKINSNGKEVTDHNILSTTLKYGDDWRLRDEIKTLAFILKNNMIQTHYELALAGWNVKKGEYYTAIKQYTAVKGKLGDAEGQIDLLIEKLKGLQAQKVEKERWEREQRELERERERQLAEERRQLEEYERQRQYAAQQRAAEERRQQKLQAWANVAAAAATMAQGINNAVQQRYNPQYRQPQVSTNRNYNAHYNQQVGNINANELRHAKKLYNDWVQRAEREMKEYIEADAKLKVPGISQMTRTHEQQRRSRARSYLKDSCLKMMRSYRNRAAQLGGNIPISQTELKVEALLK
ncbi:MAG: hypothetical protein IIV54_04840 [Bacteroidaceae bacterium]|nr:hypothetical protein [Bacteroidaceae bacterium]